MGCVLLCCSIMVMGQNTETVKRSFQVVEPTQEMWFCACNIEGDVKVEAYDGNTIEVEVIKKITAKNEADIKKGMEDVTVEFAEGDGFVRARLATPYNRYREKDDPLECGWDWQQNRERVGYRYRLDFKVKVPRQISVKISTVNDSDLSVKGVKGQVYASNVNGDVDLVDLANDTKASTVNGTIEVSYLSMPKVFADFNTVNGNIEVTAPASSQAVYSFESQWGQVFSDFEFSKKLAPKMTQETDGKGAKLYKIANSNSYQVGSGGPQISFKTLNGDVMIRKGK